MINKNLVALSTALFVSGSLADGITIIPSMEFGQTHYSLGFKGDFPLPVGITEVDNQFSESGSVYKFNLTFAYNKIYLDLSSSVTADMQFVQVVPEVPAIESWAGDRKEYTVTAGYSIFESGSVFIGYRKGKLQSKGLAPTNGLAQSTFLFESDGPFIGANYGIIANEDGVLAVNIAYADLEASLEETIFGFPIPATGGDGDGLKAGISWRAELTDNLRYSVSVDRYQYTTNLSNQLGVNSKMVEEESTIKVGISSSF
ncbi:hypothetical protein [Alteromonas lipolytica]|uniref:Outer membrane protein beta-barrel domain-containing protein n=1 Tax=Alteromonas lipolytica TaxID=1856405 RepID=A0A1E8FFM6_9ALTE|nr:hypothetical protein [Alteromonas lipolytica]OFI34724.1 hypothetical protein BFC17_14180 [Alteromonas lipolytica]GGF53493.1 hypothetical protein GCM10011338_02030 [Alteromonas lipolytica]